MIIEEMSNSVNLKLENGESISQCIENVVQKFHIKRGIIRGTGFASLIDYGTLKSLEPLFFNKFNLENNVIITYFNGIIENQSIVYNFVGSDNENKIYTGRFYNGVVSQNFEIFIEILLTD